MDYFPRKSLSKYLITNTIDFNNWQVPVEKIRGRWHRATLQNYNATWTSLLTNEKAKLTFTRRLLRPNRPPTWALLQSDENHSLTCSPCLICDCMWEGCSKDIWEFHVIFLLGYFHESTGQKTFENFMQHFYWIIFFRALVKRHWRITYNIFIGLFSWEHWSKDNNLIWFEYSIWLANLPGAKFGYTR